MSPEVFMFLLVLLLGCAGPADTGYDSADDGVVVTWYEDAPGRSEDGTSFTIEDDCDVGGLIPGGANSMPVVAPDGVEGGEITGQDWATGEWETSGAEDPDNWFANHFGYVTWSCDDEPGTRSGVVRFQTTANDLTVLVTITST